MDNFPSAVHPTAVVHPGAEIGPGCEIGPYCVIEPGVELGADCALSPHVHLLGRTRIGPGARIGSGSVIGGEPQDKAYQGEPTGVVIGRNCRFFEHVTVHRACGEGVTRLGDGVMMMAGSHVGHNAQLDDEVVMVNAAAAAGHSRIGAQAFLSAYSAVHQYGQVGRLTLVGGACMLTRDAPPFSIVVGSYPARWRGPNALGMKRAGFSSAQRGQVRKALHALFAGERGPQAVAEELSSHAEALVVELARFVLDAPRGVCAGPRPT